MAYAQGKERAHLAAVVQHRAIDQAGSLLGVFLEILEMGGDDAPHALGVELRQDGLRHRAADLRLGTGAKLIDQRQRMAVAAGQEGLHRAQV